MNRRRFIVGGLVASSIAAAGWLTWFDQEPDGIDVREFGARGDGVTDDTHALQTAIESSAAAGTPLRLSAGSYLVTRTLSAATGLDLRATDATLITAIPDLGDAGRSAPTLQVRNVAEVSIQGLRIDGQRHRFSHTEFKPCLNIDGASDVMIRDCVLFDAKGDGIILNDTQPGHHNRRVTVERTLCSGNYRLGLAITDVVGANIDRCVFTGNSGTSPMGGVDIEPDRDDCLISDVRITRCDIFDNGELHVDGAGLYVALHEDAPSQAGIMVEDCTIRRNGIQGVIVYHGRDVTLRNCEISANGNSGLEVFRTSRGIVIDGGTVRDNGAHGIAAIRDASHTLTGLEVRSVAIRDNSTSSPYEYSGIALEGPCDDIAISECAITGRHRCGVRVGRSVGQVFIDDMRIEGQAADAVCRHDAPSPER